MKIKIEKMNSYFDEKISECRKREEELLSDERSDEANFEKIRLNIYDIFKTVLAAAQKACGDDKEATKNFFLDKLEQIPSNWYNSLERAQIHGDEEKQQTEKIKIEVAEDIKKIFTGFLEES